MAMTPHHGPERMREVSDRIAAGPPSAPEAVESERVVESQRVVENRPGRASSL
jgi:hypothetical protein